MKPACKCIKKIQKELEGTNTVLKTELMLNMAEGKAVEVLTIPTAKRNSRLRERAAVLVCRRCPVCGKKYVP